MAQPEATLVKRSGEKRLYSFDFSQFPELVAADTLTGTPTVTASPTGLTLGTPAIVGQTVQVTIQAGTGTPATVYSLVCTCSTAAGSILECGGYLTVDDS